MQSLTFVFEATLLAPLVEFATSSSGHVEPRQGLALGWLGSVVAGLAVMFGAADRAQADDCHGISEGPGYAANCAWVCTGGTCKYDHNGNPIGWHEEKYCHSEHNGCQFISVSSSCIAC